MALSNQIAAYDDCFEVYERAWSDEVGVRVEFPSKTQASLFQMRMCHARMLQREENKRIFDKGHLSWGKSLYDKLVVRLREDTEGHWWVYVERHGQDLGTIESLSNNEAADETRTLD